MPKEQGYRLRVVGCRISSWGKLVENVRKSLWQVRSLYALSTKSLNYLTSQVIFMLSFSASSTQAKPLFTQPKSGNFNLLNTYLTPLSTSPINKTTI